MQLSLNPPLMQKIPPNTTNSSSNPHRSPPKFLKRSVVILSAAKDLLLFLFLFLPLPLHLPLPLPLHLHLHLPLPLLCPCTCRCFALALAVALPLHLPLPLLFYLSFPKGICFCLYLVLRMLSTNSLYQRLR